MKSITKLDKKNFNKKYIVKINKCNIPEDKALIEMWKSKNAYTWPFFIENYLNSVYPRLSFLSHFFWFYSLK